MEEPSLCKLFQDRDQWPEECAELAAVFDLGWVSAEEYTYRCVPEPRPGTPRHRVWSKAHFDGASTEHGDLKWWAWNWLRQQGEPHPQFEYNAWYGRADVAAPTIGCAVECGDTPARKVIRSLWEGQWSVFVLFPYLYVEDFSVEPMPRLYMFRATEAGLTELPAMYRAGQRRTAARSAKLF